MPELKKPVENLHCYHPMEKPTRYPLELTADHHICLWSPDGQYKYTIAYFIRDKEGYDLQFVGERPLDKRVNWKHFRELIVQGQRLADSAARRVKDD